MMFVCCMMSVCCSSGTITPSDSCLKNYIFFSDVSYHACHQNILLIEISFVLLFYLYRIHRMCCTCIQGVHLSPYNLHNTCLGQQAGWRSHEKVRKNFFSLSLPSPSLPLSLPLPLLFLLFFPGLSLSLFLSLSQSLSLSLSAALS